MISAVIAQKGYDTHAWGVYLLSGEPHLDITEYTPEEIRAFANELIILADEAEKLNAKRNHHQALADLGN